MIFMAQSSKSCSGTDEGAVYYSKNRDKTECGKASLRPALLLQGMFYVKEMWRVRGCYAQGKALRFPRLKEE